MKLKIIFIMLLLMTVFFFSGYYTNKFFSDSCQNEQNRVNYCNLERDMIYNAFRHCRKLLVGK